jgi:pentatricopeptide repeat protein
MKGSDNIEPDSWSYTAMLNVYTSGGNVNKAMALFDEMTEKHVDLNIMGCTCLIQCLGRAKRTDDLVRVFELSVQSGIKPDDRLSGCLLSVISYCDDDKEAKKIISCLLQYNPKLVSFLNMIDNEETSFETIIEEFKLILSGTEYQARRPYCNCLIDICRNKKLYDRAHELLYMGTVYGLYPGLHTKTAEEWRLNVRTLSIGAAHTAFEEWMGTVTKMISRDEPLPYMFTASTGSGRHKFSHGMAKAFGNHVRKFGAPFKQSEAGFFLATREDLESWVESRAQALSV